MIGRIDKEKDVLERYGQFEQRMRQARQNIIDGNFNEALSSPLRGACTHCAYILLCDMLGEDEAIKIVIGEQMFKNGNLKKNDNSRAEGKFIIEQARDVLVDKLKNNSEKNDWQDIGTLVDNLKICYNDSSADPHGSKLRVSDSLENTARLNYASIVELLNRICIDTNKFVSEETKKICQKFQNEEELKLPYVRIDNDAERMCWLANEKSILDDRLRDVAQGYAKAILVLPSNFADVVDDKIRNSLLRIPWSLVIDYNQHDNSGFYEQMGRDWRDEFCIVKAPEEREDGDRYVIADGIYRRNWLFAAGDKANFRTMQRKPRQVRRFISDIVKKLFVSNYTSKFVFFVFHNDSTDENNVKDVIDRLYNQDELESEFDSRFEFFIFNGKDDLSYAAWEEIIKVNSGRYQCIGNFHLDVFDLASKIEEENIFSQKKEKKQFSLNVNGKEISLEPRDRAGYAEAGLEFVDEYQEYDNEGYDFYKGAEITWKELRAGEGVERSVFESHRNLLIKKIKELKGVSLVRILCEPGAGATTHSRQLVFSIEEKSRNSDGFQCTVVVIKRYNREFLIDRLIGLSELVKNTPLLVLFESSILSQGVFNDTETALKDAQKNILFLQVLNNSGAVSVKKDLGGDMVIGKRLSVKEKDKFFAKYKDKGLDDKKRVELVKMEELQVIDFPLMIHDDQVSSNLRYYIKGLMDDLPVELQEVCAYIAFVFEYTRKPLNLFLLQSLLGDKKRFDQWDSKYQKTIKSILSEQRDGNNEHANLWRPRYSVFSKFVLAYHFNKCENETMEWSPSDLFRMANSFVDICARNGDVLAENDEDVLIALFTERSDEDYRISDDVDFIQKFSLLVQNLLEYDYVKPLMEKLIEVYPNNPYFLAHYARFLYEYVNSNGYNEENKLFEKAEGYINRAITCDDKNDKVYHMKGMLYLRRIQTMMNRLEKSKDHKDIGETMKLRSKLIEWAKLARDAFRKSEFYAPFSTYGYLSEGKVCRDSLKVAKILLNEADFCFVEKDPWNEYVDGLNQVISELMNLNRREQNKEDKKWEDFYKLRQFQMKVVGCKEEDMRRYYNRLEQLDMTKTERLHYTQMYYWSVIYWFRAECSCEEKIPDVDIMEKLPENTRDSLERKLEQAMNWGSIPAFRQLHELKITGSNPYSIDEAIRHWRRCVDKCEHGEGIQRNGFDYMNALYMLASYYSARSILAGLNEEVDFEDQVDAEKYYRKAKEEASKNHWRNTIFAYYYLGQKDDARVLLGADRPLTFRRWVDCRITSVGNKNKSGGGKAVILPCGLSASFRAVEFGKQDEGRTIKRQVGFRYEGVGLYDGHDEESSDAERSGREDVFNEEEDSENANDRINTDETSQKEMEVSVGEKDEERCNDVESGVSRNDTLENSLSEGIYHEGTSFRKAYLIDSDGKKREVRTQKGSYIEDGSKVSFVPKQEPRRNKPNGWYYTAYDVELIDE